MLNMHTKDACGGCQQTRFLGIYMNNKLHSINFVYNKIYVLKFYILNFITNIQSMKSALLTFFTMHDISCKM